MWILTSLSRPRELQRMAASYRWTDETVVLALYEKDPMLGEYMMGAWPKSWQTAVVAMPGNGPTYNALLEMKPKEPFYGFLADDILLDTPGMLKELEREAGQWNIAYSNEGHQCERLATMPCIGGDLVREVGYLAPPHIVHWAIDDVWTAIGRKLDRLRYRADLRYTHLNPIWGTAPDDKTYRLARQRSFGYQDIFRAWQVGGELDRIVARVNQGATHG